MSTCRKCACSPHHGPCGTWAYAREMIIVALVSMFGGSFIADFYIWMGWMGGN